MRAIVIDDSGAQRSILRRILSQLGFEAVEAADGQQGIATLKESWPIDLALVDWNMPVLDGIGFVREARADTNFDAMKIVMVTSETAMERIVEALECGANEYIMKPFTSDILGEKLSLLGIIAPPS